MLGGVPDPEQLPARVREAVDAARARWPKLDLDPATYWKFVQQRAAESGDDPGELYLEDLALVHAVLEGSGAGIAILDVEYLDELRAAARLGGSEPEEIAQRLRTRLLVDEPGREAKIRSYRGRGPLRSWLRVCMTREALSARRQAKAQRSAGDEALEMVATGGDDPELAVLKEDARRTFREAFHQALELLSARERNVLRFSLVDGLSTDDIANLYKVHRVTVTRWLAKARERLLRETRRRIAMQLPMGRMEFESMMGLIQSRLDVSLTGALADADVNEEPGSAEDSDS